MYDLLIKNVSVIDGSGEPAYLGNVAAVDGKLVCTDVDPTAEAKVTLDGTGLKLSPGFIDSHTHADMVTCEDVETYELCKINQGITTEICGQCGISLFPLNLKFMKEHEDCLSSFVTKEHMKEAAGFSQFTQFLDYASKLPKGQNFVFNIGHGTLRTYAMGVDNRKPTPDELETMKMMLKEAMEHGCFGLSSGLIYTPSVYSDTEELIELCKVIAPYGGVYATHMRNEADHVVDAVRESIKVAETAGVKLVISHHKVCGKDNWGLASETLRLIHEAIDRGVDILIDQYPYEGSQTYMNVVIPPKYFAEGLDQILVHLTDPAWRAQVKEEIANPDPSIESSYKNCGGFSGMLVLSSPNVPDACGLTVAQYAEKLGKDEFDTFFDLLLENKGVGLCAYFSMNEKEIQQIYMDPNTVPGTDCIIPMDGSPCHPRTYGTFVRTISHFQKECGLLSLEVAIRKQTYQTALGWGIKNKGLIRDGYDADLVLFNYDTIKDTPSFENGRQLCEGIEAVIVNGEIVYQNKKLTGNYPGKCILKDGSSL